MLQQHIDRLEQKAAEAEETSGAGKTDTRNLFAAAEILREYAALVQSTYTTVSRGSRGTAAFTLWKKDFDERTRTLRKQASLVSEELEHLFRFCETVFPDGQELIILVTELTIRPQTAGFIARYGCDGYYRNNQKLQFSERSRNLRHQAEKLLADTSSLQVPDADADVEEEMPSDTDLPTDTTCYFP